jgi:AI-2 transport protein TqsA
MPRRLRDEQLLFITGSLTVVAAVAVAVALYHTQLVMMPFVLSLFIASVVAPIFDYQVVKLKFPRAMAVFSTLIFVIAIFGLFNVLIIHVIQLTIVKTHEYENTLALWLESVVANLEARGVDVEIMVFAPLQQQFVEAATKLAQLVPSLLAYVVLILVFVTFLLAGRDSHAAVTGVYREIDLKVRRYLVTKLAISAATGFLVWVALSLLQLPLAAAFGLLAFLLNFIPNIGSIVATLLPLPIAMAEFSGQPAMIVLVIAIPATIQMTIGNFIEPKLMGEGLELHPIVVLLSLAFWGLLWGIIGMVLAVPITAVVRIVLLRFQVTEMFGKLLGGELPRMD